MSHEIVRPPAVPLGAEISSLGTTRGGRSVNHIGGYVHYPGSADERSFSVVGMKDRGEWYVDSFSVGARAVPR